MIIEYSDDIREQFRVLVQDVTANMREADYLELAATNNEPTVKAFTDAAMIYPGRKFVAMGNKYPVGVGGVANWYQGVGNLWMWATDDFASVAKESTKKARSTIKQFFDDGGHRVQCFAMCTHSNAHRWLELLGLEQEHKIKGMGKGGEDFYLYSMVKNYV